MATHDLAITTHRFSIVEVPLATAVGVYAGGLIASAALAAFAAPLPGALLYGSLLVVALSHFLFLTSATAAPGADIKTRIPMVVLYKGTKSSRLIRVSASLDIDGDQPAVIPPLDIDGDQPAVTPTCVPGAVLLVFALVSMAGLLAITMPMSEIARAYRPIVLGVPLAVGVALAVRMIGLSMTPAIVRHQLAIALTGIPFGLLAYLVARPDPITASAISIGGLILFGGILQEVTFRGLVHRHLSDIWPRAGLFLGAAIFASTYLGSRSVGLVAVMILMGVALGWFVDRTGSLIGVAAAQSLVAVGCLVIWPSVF
jgi:membrane protease YdiL (CAAX protease family)